jgi:hypothetical protein
VEKPAAAPVQRPTPILAAAGLVGLEGVAMAVLGVLELVHLSGDRLVLALTTALFFVVVGAGLGACALGLAGLHSWARGPVVAAQLIGVLTAFSFYGGETTPVAIGLGVVCVAALVGVLHPSTTRALASDEYDED